MRVSSISKYVRSGFSGKNGGFGFSAWIELSLTRILSNKYEIKLPEKLTSWKII